METQYLLNTDKTYKIKPKNIRALKEALLIGPVAIMLSAHNIEWDYYASGIIDSETCGTQITHAVIGVGYGQEKPRNKKLPPRDFIIIKNSWGKRWGENGYARIALSKDKESKGICGSLKQNYIATVKQVNGPSSASKLDIE